MNTCPFWKRVPSLAALLAAILISFSTSDALAGQYVRLAGGLDLYYEDFGKGPAIVFIPGWTGTTSLFQHQLPHFAKQYRVVSYDPRGQGRSSKPAEGHHYKQHGEDLKAFLDALGLRNVTLVGFSWGCHTAYAYFRAHGTDNVRAFVCIDSPPKPIIESGEDWGLIKSPVEMRYFHDGVLHDRTKLTREFVQSMVTRPLTEAEMEGFLRSLTATPASVAVQLDYDGLLADYSAEARAIDGRLPVLNVLADPGWFPGYNEAGVAWLKRNAPHAEIQSFGLHLMPWEFPDRFNAAVDAFLAKVR